MVSFSCEVCNDTVIKKKLDQHAQRCRGAYFTCIDCSTTFQGTDYRKHTSCISEAEKYEKGLYKKKTKQPKPAPAPAPAPAPPTKTQPTLFKDVTGSQNLYKVLKKASKDDSKKLKDILKSLKITKVDDKFVIES
ncbi:conserved hypothetical protein [Candida dubliniensis CD36]|uniref:Zinc finger C2H2 LYAR-type domain-containing protein n=1 Tax=Candida dubliniensis (strain CD36 / ATCC MYA-646 / CBS 7987 / NCPF 3949 / NRRL Y-17841) TaxID=573826 RepID=B9WN71_CANDC|nr:conserved hypothetical protein [Candida dubliniensis CD36]CAX40538.1 conserved hypothetical protein [Candida dubliniensis CD36]